MDEKIKSILVYVFGWLGGLIVLLACKDCARNTKIHAAQSIIICGLYTVIIAIYRILPIYIPLFSKLIHSLYIALIIWGIIKAAKEDPDAELPVVGNIAHSIFGKILG